MTIFIKKQINEISVKLDDLGLDEASDICDELDEVATELVDVVEERLKDQLKDIENN